MDRMTTMARYEPAKLVAALPYARRYARALTGRQQAGDALVAAALPSLPQAADARNALYAAISARVPKDRKDQLLPTNARMLLLLTSVEDRTLDDAAAILGLRPDEAGALLRDARARLKDAATADVMIIEDEAVIALDLEMVLVRCGHRVVGVAASEADAVALAARTRPGLILADVNLGRGGSGASAVARILSQQTVPVIFVTAYPEQLLSGHGIEPAYVLTKPFDPTTLAVATFEAANGGLLRI